MSPCPLSQTRYDLVIFDFDGTLADSADWVIGMFNTVAKRFKFKCVTEDEIAMLRGRPTREVVRYLGIPAWKMPALAKHVRALSAQSADEIALFDGVERLLAALSSHGIKLAMVSSNSEFTVRRVLGEKNAARISHYDCGAAMFGKAAKFRRVAKRFGVHPSRVLCVGDETRDVEAANKAGMASAAVTWGYAKPSILEQQRPSHMVPSIDALLALLGAASPNSATPATSAP